MPLLNHRAPLGSFPFPPEPGAWELGPFASRPRCGRPRTSRPWSSQRTNRSASPPPDLTKRSCARSPCDSIPLRHGKGRELRLKKSKGLVSRYRARDPGEPKGKQVSDESTFDSWGLQKVTYAGLAWVGRGWAGMGGGVFLCWVIRAFFLAKRIC